MAQTVSAAESSAGAQSIYFVTPGSFAIEYLDTVINFSRICTCQWSALLIRVLSFRTFSRASVPVALSSATTKIFAIVDAFDSISNARDL